ncbi:hypothetical protein T310_10087, partial [Rasamsonia emersonii CBS 393.64]
VFPLKMMHGGRAHPAELTDSIAVTHSRFPGCRRGGRPNVSDLVTTRVVEIRPIANPVSSIIDIVFKNAILLNSTLEEVKPFTNNLTLLSQF